MVNAHIGHDEITPSDLLTMELYFRKEGNVSPQQAEQLLRFVSKRVTSGPVATTPFSLSLPSRPHVGAA